MMSEDWTRDQAMMHEAFRVAYLLSDSRAAAVDVLRDALQHLANRPEALDRRRACRYLFSEIRRLALKKTRFRKGILVAGKSDAGNAEALSGIEDGRVWEMLRALPEPVRSAVVLFYATSLDHEDLVKILSVNETELVNELEIARRFLREEAVKS